jgi:hypothetical protein
MSHYITIAAFIAMLILMYGRTTETFAPFRSSKKKRPRGGLKKKPIAWGVMKATTGGSRKKRPRGGLKKKPVAWGVMKATSEF